MPPTPPARRRRPSRTTLATIASILTALAAIFASLDSDNDRGGRTVTIHVERPAGAPGPADDVPAPVEVPAEAVDQAADVGDHDHLKTEDPPGAPREELEAAREQQERLAQDDALPVVTPLAAPSQRGCTTRLVGNYSSRRGVRPRLIVLHYTVSPNRPGWDDVWSIVALFDRPSFAASSHYVIDGEGHCAYIVRESDKSWTNAAANPVTITVEIVNTGREDQLIGPRGQRVLAQVIADAGKRWAIPLQLGAVNGCTVTRPGILDHNSLGQCGGGHVDVTPYTIDAIIRAARAAAGAPPTPPSSAPAKVRSWCGRSRSSDELANGRRIRLARRAGWVCKGATPVRYRITTTDRTTCRKLQRWRTAGRPASQGDLNARRRRALEARGVYCPNAGPPRVRSAA